jgi:deoxyribodipyrimidine photolyase-related protein
MGLITPEDIVNEIKKVDYKDPGLNNLEGFTRQVIGWREFIRFMNLKNYDHFHKNNFFNHKKKLTKDWYEGSTNIPILDDTIMNLKKYGYVHHIPRLMVISNLMNLSGIAPQEVYKWFMECFIDSSDWVMTPNVFGMGLFSDGGIFATKPYLCGSNYLLKMSNYKKDEWSTIVDGLYWSFIYKYKDYFKSNHRLSMMYHSVIKMEKSKLDSHIKNARNFIQQYTS